MNFPFINKMKILFKYINKKTNKFKTIQNGKAKKNL